MNEKYGFEAFMDFLGKIIALITIVTYIALIVNSNWTFIDNETVLNVLNIVKAYSSLVLVLVVGIEAAVSSQSALIRIIFFLLVAVVIVFQFFPDTFSALVNYIPHN